MPIYPVINLKTKEKKELNLTMSDYDQWRKDNPDWDKDWSTGVAGAQEVGDWRDKMSKTHPGWKDVMAGARKADRGFDRNGYQW